MIEDLVAWLRAQLDDDERIAREASRHQHGDGWTPTGEHWQWVEPDGDEVLVLDPMLDEYLGEGRASLRSVEEYPGTYYSLPHFVVSETEEMRTVDAMHIVRWDPARVVAEVEAKRRIVDLHEQARPDGHDRQGYRFACEHCSQTTPCPTLRLLAQPYAGRPGWRPEWAA